MKVLNKAIVLLTFCLLIFSSIWLLSQPHTGIVYRDVADSLNENYYFSLSYTWNEYGSRANVDSALRYSLLNPIILIASIMFGLQKSIVIRIFYVVISLVSLVLSLYLFSLNIFNSYTKHRYSLLFLSYMIAMYILLSPYFIGSRYPAHSYMLSDTALVPLTLFLTLSFYKGKKYLIPASLFAFISIAFNYRHVLHVVLVIMITYLSIILTTKNINRVIKRLILYNGIFILITALLISPILLIFAYYIISQGKILTPPNYVFNVDFILRVVIPRIRIHELLLTHGFWWPWIDYFNDSTLHYISALIYVTIPMLLSIIVNRVKILLNRQLKSLYVTSLLMMLLGLLLWTLPLLSPKTYVQLLTYLGSYGWIIRIPSYVGIFYVIGLALTLYVSIVSIFSRFSIIPKFHNLLALILVSILVFSMLSSTLRLHSALINIELRYKVHNFTVSFDNNCSRALIYDGSILPQLINISSFKLSRAVSLWLNRHQALLSYIMYMTGCNCAIGRKDEVISYTQQNHKFTYFYIPAILFIDVSQDLSILASLWHIIPVSSVRNLGVTTTTELLHGTAITRNSVDVIIKDYYHYEAILLNRLVSGTSKGILLQPFHVTLRGAPKYFWSRASAEDLPHGEWHSYLEKLDIQNWQSDYGYGLAFTWSRFYIPSTLKPSNKDLIINWSFNNRSLCLIWETYTPSKQFNAIQELICYNGILMVKLYNSTWGWKTIKSPLIPIDSNHAYRFVIKIRGINAQGVHVKIAEFNSNRRLIDVKYVKSVGGGTFDWKEVVFDYVPSSSGVRYVQLQIWHGHLTDKPLPNIIMIDYVKVYDVTRYAKRVTLDMPFDVPRSGDYKIFVRYFESQKGGAIRIYLDGKLIAEVSTVSQLNRFVRRDLGTFSLEAGRHVIMLENVEGFNAVNVFVLIPVDEYNKLVKEFEKILENKTIIYLFEAESDMFRTKAKIVKDINASNGEMLHLKPSGYAWQRFEIVKNGYYMIAVRLNGGARIVIDNNSFKISSSDFAFHYLGPIYLEKGEHIIRIEALNKPLYLDIVWIYSVKSPSSRMAIEDLFKVKEKPAKVIHYERNDPTLWRAEVVAKKPFMLVFAEGYDPLWEARVYKDGRLVEKVRSIPVYGVINGFWINATGNLTIVIRYVPQDWFELGLKISATTFALCVFYLIWDWRRGRGDRWVLWIEGRFRDVFRSLKKVA